MAQRYGDRHQNMLFPQSIDDYITEDDPVRAYDAFVDALDWDSLNIKSDKKKTGCPEYNPKSMLKVLIYGYSYGIRSSRKLERALHHNLSFIWLASGLKPDDRTIARFRRKNKKALKQVFKQCARLCIKSDLIEGNTLFVDGTKLRANACLDRTRTPEGCKEALAKIDQRIDEILSECDKVDRSEKDCGSLVKLKDEFAIPDLAGSLRIELIVMETVCRTGIPGVLIGNTAESVLGQVDCSVLAVKPEGFVSPVTLQDTLYECRKPNP